MSQTPPTVGPYRPRTFEELTNGMIALQQTMQTGITDYNVGSIMRSILEAFASVAEELSTDQVTLLQEAVRQLGYAVFNFPPLPAAAATGSLLFTVGIAQTITIGANLTWQPTGSMVTYQTTEAVTITTTGANQVVTVSALCNYVGTIGNLAAGVLGSLLSPLTPITLVTSGGFANGIDPEAPEDMMTRFGEYVTGLHRGTTDAAAIGAQTTALYNGSGQIIEQVVKARGIDNAIDGTVAVGTAKVAIFNGVGTPGGLVTSANLVTACQQIIDGYTDANGNLVPGYKAAGIPTTVVAVTEERFTVVATVHPTFGANTTFLTPVIGAAIIAYFTGLNIGDPLILAVLAGAVAAVAGVGDVSLAIATYPGGAPVTVNYTPPSAGLCLLNTATVTYD